MPEDLRRGVTSVTTTACSVSGLGTEVNGGTEMGPAVVGLSGADRLVQHVKMSDVAW